MIWDTEEQPVVTRSSSRFLADELIETYGFERYRTFIRRCSEAPREVLIIAREVYPLDPGDLDRS